ncbi:hypothetical protein GGI25_003266 [Coemansia spiralis]|uniref:AB hydrolase-1 domain-containing protein n=2 Tax=Coemansia TaxID=4863 RepID=A0A9W8G7G1_9FUNG|nr:Alpha/Beta hydrolase protein [Coemansia spiralis]KAJ1989978.1 hypothetical protein EDC05_004329 [Coemansia umbellata]KAJ2621492.1 hypothetical protein GGI26_004071 [Coemansia sp. RSA 1358]KAJ2677170.1 hypothetical protein GGI25_003266 [Coemansia spiralis]
MPGLQLSISVVLIVSAGLLYSLKRYKEACRVKIVAASKSEISGELGEHTNVGSLLNKHCPSLTDPELAYMVPTPYLCSGMVQTVYCTFAALKRDQYSKVDYERESRTMSDGGTISLDWYPHRSTDIAGRQPIFIIIPGLGGSSYEYHIRCVVKTLVVAGPTSSCRVVVMNHRGSARTPLTSAKFYNAYDTADYRDTVQYIKESFPNAPLLGVGFSLGANLLTKYLGEEADRSPLAAAAAICCPFDTEIAGKALDKRGFLNDYLFQPNLMATLKRSVKRNIDVIKTGYSDDHIKMIMGAKRMSEIDNLVTAKVYGHEDCWDYYRAASSTPYVDHIRTPYLAINAQDDPITPEEGIPFEKFEKNPYLALALVKHGGHLGLFTGLSPKVWYVQPVAEFFNAVLCTKE